MAGRSIGELNAKVTANASQFVQEFQRADNVSRRVASSIDKEVDHLTKNLKKKFSLGDIGKDILKGFGIGSGFAVAETAAGLLVDHFKAAAEAAKDVEESTARQLEYTKKIIGLSQTDDQKLAALRKDFAAKGRELDDARAPKYITKRYRGREGEERVVRERLDQTAEETKLIQQLDAEYKKLGADLAELEKKQKEKSKDDFKKANEESVRNQEALSTAATAALKKEDDARKHIADAISKQDQELEKLAVKYAEMADPSLEFKKQMAEVDTVLRSGKISAEQAADAIAALNRAMQDAEERRVDQALEKFFGPIDEKQKEIDENQKKLKADAKDLGWAFESAFEDAIVNGEKFSDVLKGLEKDILRVILRKALLEPIINSIAGSSVVKGITNFFGGFFAEGGRPPVGRPSIVGENGPELFVPDSSGTVVPNNALGGGSTYIIDARGADRTGLARLESLIRDLNGSIETRAVAAITEHRRRGAAFA